MSTSAKDVMIKNVKTVRTDSLINDVIDNRVQKVIVMNGNKIAGIVSPFDFLYLVSGDSKNE